MPPVQRGTDAVHQDCLFAMRQIGKQAVPNHGVERVTKVSPPSIGRHFIFMAAASKAAAVELLLVREVQVKIGNHVSESTHWGVDQLM